MPDSRGANGIWWLLAAFALIAAGSALARIVPRKQSDSEPKGQEQGR